MSVIDLQRSREPATSINANSAISHSGINFGQKNCIIQGQICINFVESTYLILVFYNETLHDVWVCLRDLLAYPEEKN